MLQCFFSAIHSDRHESASTRGRGDRGAQGRDYLRGPQIHRWRAVTWHIGDQTMAPAGGRRG